MLWSEKLYDDIITSNQENSQKWSVRDVELFFFPIIFCIENCSSGFQLLYYYYNFHNSKSKNYLIAASKGVVY